MKLLLLAAASLLSAPVLAEPPGGKLAPVAPQAVPKETAVTPTCTALTADPLKVASDPEEGGQVTARKSTGTKPKIGDLTVTHKADTASTKMMSEAPPSSDGCSSSAH